MTEHLPPTTPVLVGIAQVEQRCDDPETAKEPLELMIEAVEAAAEDAGSSALLQQADAVRVVRGIWRYGDPGRAVAQHVGCPGARTGITPYGGNFVQATVNRTCVQLRDGEFEIAILTGAECGQTQARLRRAGKKIAWDGAPGTPDEELGKNMDMAHEAEQVRDIRRPIQMYPIFENALRYARGESIEAHVRRISELWAGFNAVACENPHAWIREPYTAEQIRTAGERNRMISFPYPKLMNSNSNVDQGAALILTTVAKARALGIDASRFVFPHAGTDAHDTPTVSHRDTLDASPAIRLAGRRAMELAGAGPSDLAHLDVYSCFPSAVQVAAKELELGEDRPLTVTGGLTFGGGPMNNYVMHGIARMAEVLREDRGAQGMCTANGGFLTKHAFGIYSTDPPEQLFQHEDLQPQVDALPTREVVQDWDGEASIEAYTVMFDGEGAAIGHAACRLPDGRRTWANLPDRAVAQAMTEEEFCGRSGRIDGQGTLTVTN